MNSKKLLCLISLFIPCLSAPRIKDPHGIFCGNENCYEILSVPREASLSEIKKSYRSISLENHPDKNLKDEKASKEKFSKISKAYTVLTNSTKREEFDFILDHPDAYWIKYGTHVVHKYAPKTDIKLVILGLLVVFSGMVYGLQYSKYLKAVDFIEKAAEANLPLTKGGTDLSKSIREEAQTILAQRLAEQQANKPRESSKKLPKKTKKEKLDEEKKELKTIIHELAVKAEIKGSHRKPTYEDLLMVKMVLWAPKVARELQYTYNWVVTCKIKGINRLPPKEEEYWTMKAVGSDAWENASAEAKKEALKDGIWSDSGKVEAWLGKNAHNLDFSK